MVKCVNAKKEAITIVVVKLKKGEDPGKLINRFRQSMKDSGIIEEFREKSRFKSGSEKRKEKRERKKFLSYLDSKRSKRD